MDVSGVGWRRETAERIEGPEMGRVSHQSSGPPREGECLTAPAAEFDVVTFDAAVGQNLKGATHERLPLEMLLVPRVRTVVAKVAGDGQTFSGDQPGDAHGASQWW
jgi:hypothetical protein